VSAVGLVITEIHRMDLFYERKICKNPYTFNNYSTNSIKTKIKLGEWQKITLSYFYNEEKNKGRGKRKTDQSNKEKMARLTPTSIDER
jgi:hypothetical protein